jgi:hypothetical protein
MTVCWCKGRNCYTCLSLSYFLGVENRDVSAKMSCALAQTTVASGDRMSALHAEAPGDSAPPTVGTVQGLPRHTHETRHSPPAPTVTAQDVVAGCPLQCTSMTGGNCDTWQFPIVNGNGDAPVDATCGKVNVMTGTSTVTNTYDSSGSLYYCKDASLSSSDPPVPCTPLKTALYSPCDTMWAQLDNVNVGFDYAEFWSSTCDSLAQKLVATGKYKSVGCYNQDTTDFGIESRQLMQAWPSATYNVDAATYGNTLGCQLNPKNTITACDTLGNLCGTNLFSEIDGGTGKHEIVINSEETFIETLGAIVEAVADGL